MRRGVRLIVAVLLGTILMSLPAFAYGTVEPSKLRGLVADDIQTRFESGVPKYIYNWESDHDCADGFEVEGSAAILGDWILEFYGDKFPSSIVAEGRSIGNRYECLFGTDVSNNFKNNFSSYYGYYFALKDYYTSGGTRSVAAYKDLCNRISWDGYNSEVMVKQLYDDLRTFITNCNNIVRAN